MTQDNLLPITTQGPDVPITRRPAPSTAPILPPCGAFPAQAQARRLVRTLKPAASRVGRPGSADGRAVDSARAVRPDFRTRNRSLDRPKANSVALDLEDAIVPGSAAGRHLSQNMYELQLDPVRRAVERPVVFEARKAGRRGGAAVRAWQTPPAAYSEQWVEWVARGRTFPCKAVVFLQSAQQCTSQPSPARCRSWTPP